MTGKEFLFTWKPKKRWPPKYVQDLAERFRVTGPFIEKWRCQAHKKVRYRDRAYLYNQGGGPNGIFALGRIDGPAEPRTDVDSGEGDYWVPIRFELFLDPTEPSRNFIVSKDALLSLGVSVETLNHQAGGFTFTPPAAARRIDEIAASEPPLTEEAQPAEERERSREMRLEAYRRDSKLVRELKRLYDDHCQICAARPFKGQFGALTEGHHIRWLCRGGADSRNNVILLCPNHHAAMHEMDPEFDRPKLAFHFGSNTVPVALDRHLKLG